MVRTYLLLDLTQDGICLDGHDDPRGLDFELVKDSKQWQVAFRDEPYFNAGGPLVVIANVEYLKYHAWNHWWIARVVLEELTDAYEQNEIDAYASDGPIVDITDEGETLSVVRFGRKLSRKPSKPVECEWCGCIPCGCGG